MTKKTPEASPPKKRDRSKKKNCETCGTEFVAPTGRGRYCSEDCRGTPGRNAYEPTPEQRGQVEAMSAYGVPQVEIAKVLGINKETLQKHFREELDTANAKAVAAVAGKLYKKAMNGCVTSMIFFLKTRGKWSEKIQVENTGLNGGPIVTENRTFTDPIEAERAYKDLIKNL